MVDRFQEYLGEFVYGGIDGSVTTFAVVAGAVGAGLDSIIILILGFANLIADGFSMSVGAYLSAKAERDNFHKHQAREYWEVKYTPHAEREEIRDIYAAKGFSGELLEQVVEVICADRDRWVDIMMKEELGMLPAAKSPLAIGSVTFCAFVTVGLVPLLIYVWDWFFPFPGNRFLIAAILTGLAFVVIGWLKSYVTETSHWRSILETLALGVIAASLSYAVGDLLEALLR
ncbi:MAG: VIT1/CCC1 transporter family protein [Lewinellaceae bacterium]|nr:VIT1/CCC1 transporter family protein [Lewinellaceae bacterium]